MNYPLFKSYSELRSELANGSSSLITFPTNRRRSTGAVESDVFIAAMKGAVTGVNIVTTDGPGGRYGLTVSAFASVSAEPPMVLVCINRNSPATAAIMKNRRFAVNVLSDVQRDIAETFAGVPSNGKAYDFSAAIWSTARTGSPLLDDGIASFDCKVDSTLEVGSHVIYIGLVRAVANGAASPLLYTNRSYGRVCHDDLVRN